MSSALSKSFRENDELVSDLARFSESILTQEQVRKKHHLLGDEAWEQMGSDDLLVEMVEAEKIRRIKNGSAKRELARLHLVKAPAVLDSILSDPKANPRHRIDSAKALNDLSEFAPQRPAGEEDRVVVRIDLSADTKNPADVLTFEAVARPNRPSDDANVIDATPLPIQSLADDSADDLPLVRRRLGRPKGSRNKPKVVDGRPKGVPGFDV